MYKRKNNLRRLPFLGILVLIILPFISGCDDSEEQIVATSTRLVWADEFDVNGAPNSALWGFDLGDGSDQGIPGWGNDELQYYTDREENVVVQNGFLIITAREEDFEGSSYTSARLTTRNLAMGEQQYGRFEARMRLPSGQGMWPAFWLLGASCDSDDPNSAVWPACGEIDIMEYIGSKPSEIFGSIHGPGYSGGDSISKDYILTNDRYDTGFHIFGIEWGPDFINYYVDDVLYNQLTPEDVADETNGAGEWVFNNGEFYIIINLAVGGNLPGAPDENTVFPQTMLIDYVRVYQ